MAKSKKNIVQHANHGIKFHIPDVQGSTKLSALSVDQFIDLLVQTNSQIARSRRMPDPKVFEEAFEEVRKLIDNQKGDSVIDDVVQKAQHAILDKMGKMPGFIAKASGRAKDGGPSSHGPSSSRKSYKKDS
jgi:hypothetical protein